MNKLKLLEIINLASLPIMLFVAAQLVKIGKAFIRHEKRHVLIAGYIIQLCDSHGIKCKEDSV
jgi:hypothetical protein